MKLDCNLSRRPVMNIRRETARKLRVAFQRGTQSVICDNHEKREATEYCEECDKFLCRDCNRNRHIRSHKNGHLPVPASRSDSTRRLSGKETETRRKANSYIGNENKEKKKKNGDVRNRSNGYSYGRNTKM